MSVRGERIIYRERDRSRETERDPDSRRSYTTVKRYQVPDRSWEEDKVDYDKIIVKHERREDPPPPKPRTEIDFRVTERDIAKTIDHSLLRPELTLEEVLAGCALAAAYQVASVCCRPLDVGRCAGALEGAGVLVGTVVGFPHGSSTTAVKVAEAERALDDGAAELDMVLPIGWLRSGELVARETVRQGLDAAVDAFLDLLKGGNTGKMVVQIAAGDGAPAA